MKIKIFKSINDCIVILVLFILLFNPPIIYRGYLRYIVNLASFIYILGNIKETKNVLKCPFINVILKLLIAFLVYYTFILIINLSAYPQYSDSIKLEYIKFILKYASILSTSIFLILLWDKKGYSTDSILKLFIYTATLQSLCSVSALLYPSVRAFFINLMVSNVRSDQMENAILYSVEMDRRAFGFSDNLYDLFGFSMSVLAILALYLAMEKKEKKYFIISFLISISAILNARTSIVLIVIGICILFFKNIKTAIKNRYSNKSLKFVIIVAVVVAITLIFFSSNTIASSGTGKWLASGIAEINSLFHGEKKGFFYALFDLFIFFPETITGLFLGTCLKPNYFQGGSDIGYIINIFMYGIFGSILMYKIYLYAFNFCSKKSMYGYMYYMLKIIFFVYLIKGNIVGDIPLAYLLFPLSMYEAYIKFKYQF